MGRHWVVTRREVKAGEFAPARAKADGVPLAEDEIVQPRVCASAGVPRVARGLPIKWPVAITGLAKGWIKEGGWVIRDALRRGR